MEKRTVLIINEDAGTSSGFSSLLSALGYSNHFEFSHKRAMAWLNEGNLPILILLNITQSGSSGLTFLACLRDLNPALPVVVVGSTTQIRLIVEAVQLGASDYLIVPFDAQQARLAIEHALEDRKNSEVKTSAPDLLFPGVFTSPEMTRACEIAKMVARTDVPVLITGESGVGKEIFARFIHDHSPRANKRMVKVNCAALPNDLLESELFGYERGAFTGATVEKPGKFELANGGAILLDEIGEMSPQLQAKLLHVLQDGEFSRLGGNRQIRVDARILASTNRKLEQAVSRGEFRDDLYFRLNVIRIKIPPLRERKQEIVYLTNYFVQKYRDKYSSRVQELPPKTMQTFLEYDWPGNIRQLENVIKRYLILPELDVEIADVSERPRPAVSSPPQSDAALPPRQTVPPSAPAPHSLPAEFASLKQVGELAAERAEREVVLWMLEQTNWNRKFAARRLNISYKALLNKIKKWQIHRPQSTLAAGSRKRMMTAVGASESESESEQFSAHAAYSAKGVS
jgi:two-component system, NtrC family, response regulator AtoC